MLLQIQFSAFVGEATLSPELRTALENAFYAGAATVAQSYATMKTALASADDPVVAARIAIQSDAIVEPIHDDIKAFNARPKEKH